jgi:hypothetical protein
MAGDPTEEDKESGAHSPQTDAADEAGSEQSLIAYLTSYAEQLEQELGRPDEEIRSVRDSCFSPCP